MEDSIDNINGSRGPVTPPEAENQNGNENNIEMHFEEPDLTAQQEMRTPSPVDDEFELMAQSNVIVNEMNTHFNEHEEDTARSPPPESPPTKLENVENMEQVENMDNMEHVKEEQANAEEGESILSPESVEEKKERKRKHRKSETAEGDEQPGRKRKHSHTDNEEKKKLEKLKGLNFGVSKSSGGQDTRRFNFRETGAKNTPERKSTPKADRKEPTPLKSLLNKERQNDSNAHFRAENITHPVMKTFREIKTLTLPMALDLLFSINTQDVAVLSKEEMVEVLDIMFDLNRRREHLTINRMRLTDEVRKICNTELSLLNDLTHLMNGDELHFFEQLKQCPPSMDELAPFDPRIAPTDIDLTRGTTRLHAVDLIPPPETPLIGRHDPNWECFLKHIPVQFHGVAPPPMDLQQNFGPPQLPFQNLGPPPNQQMIPQNLAPIGGLPPQLGSNAPMMMQNQPPIVVSSSTINTSQPPPNFQQLPPVSIPQPVFSQPPPQLGSNAPMMMQNQPPMMELVQAEIPMGGIIQQQPHELIQNDPSVATSLMTSVPPPIQIQQKPISSSIASMDMSVPPPIISMGSDPTRDQMSPIAMFRKSLNPSLLNSLVGPPPSLNEPPPSLLTPQSGPQMSYLHQPLPGISSSGSPQRFVSSMPPPGQSPQRPFPLMSIETKKPFHDNKQRHGKSPYRDNKRRNRNRRHDKKGHSSNNGHHQQQQEREEIRASESPASSISQTTAAATIASSSVIQEPADRPLEGGDGTPGSQ